VNIYGKLTQVQCKLKAPKNQLNTFGKYKYRNCEDVLEAVKPLLAESGLTLIISDGLSLIGARYYLTATATLVNTDNPEETIQATAMARESETKKGMDDSQITGTASSYARKYCLNGLFAIDDTKDADTMDNNQPAQKQLSTLTQNQTSQIVDMMTVAAVDHADYLKYLSCESVEQIPANRFNAIIAELKQIAGARK